MEDRVAMVTGASSGIGAAIARALAADGFDVGLVARRELELDQVRDSIVDAGGSAVSLPADVTDLDGLGALVERTRAELGAVDVLVNNAAVLAVERFEDLTPDQFERHIAVNLRGPFFLTQSFLPDLRRSAAGAVVNISSVAAAVPRAGSTLYGMTKAGLEYLTRCLAAELASERIRVNAIAVGPVDTPIHDAWLEDDEERVEFLTASVPLGRLGDAEEVAWWVTQLCGQRGSWMTGAVVALDGGKALGGAEAYA